MSNFFKRQNVNLDSIFQLFSSANATQSATLSASSTRYTNNNTDLNLRYAGRDNRSQNWVSSQTFYRIFGSDISNNFNRFGAQFVMTIGGNFTYDKIAKTPSLSYSPTNVVVPNISTRINAGTYTPALTNTSSTVAVGTNIPATYVASRLGSMIINPRPISFTFNGSVTFTGSPFNVSDFITVGGGLPAGVGYSVSPSQVTDVGSYDSTLFTISITGDSASNYSITKSGSFSINGIFADLVIFGEQEYGGFYYPSFYTVPSGYESYVGFGNGQSNIGVYSGNDFSPFSTNPSIVTFNNISGNFTIYTRLNVTISFPGTPVYTGAEYLPNVVSITSITGAPVPPNIISIVPPGRVIPGTYPGSVFNYTGYTTLYREWSYSGSMTIVNFSGTTDLTQNVNGTGTAGNTIGLVTQPVTPFGLPGGVSYTASISDPGPNYPKSVSGSSASLTITGDNPAYYSITQSGTISVLAPIN